MAKSLSNKSLSNMRTNPEGQPKAVRPEKAKKLSNEFLSSSEAKPAAARHVIIKNSSKEKALGKPLVANAPVNNAANQSKTPATPVNKKGLGSNRSAIANINDHTMIPGTAQNSATRPMMVSSLSSRSVNGKLVSQLPRATKQDNAGKEKTARFFLVA
jgi:hypothetical protein